MNLKKFDKIYFPRPTEYRGKRCLTDLLAIDSETLKDGRPFLFAISDGQTFDIRAIPEIFFTRQYRDRNFICYNLKFDSGSILYTLPLPQRTRLWETGKCRYQGYKYWYIPHKRLRITRGRNGVSFWDIAQFYRTKLEIAAPKYLNEKKEELSTKNFTLDYVHKHFSQLQSYCKKDAELTAGLGHYFLKFLAEFGIKPNNLYSEASISFEYFKRRVGIVDSFRHWVYHRDACAYAFAAVSGGKFEIKARGKFNGYEYDISSAYPAEIAKLKDISTAKIRYYRSYVSDADYGYLKVKILLEKDLPHSIAVKRPIVNTYPIGNYQAYITKREYEYLISKGVDVKIVDGWYVFCKDGPARYKDVVMELYKVKQACTDKYDMKGLVAKYLLNGFYGKMLQLIEMLDGRFRAGSGFNPFYAAEICANTRLRMAKLQNQLGNKCLAVHTDSVISTAPLKPQELGKGLGNLQLTLKGSGVIIACGMYQIANKSAERGFILSEEHKWTNILEKMGKQSKAELTERRPMSWINAIYRGRPELTNVFKTFPKTLNLNCDRKRLWRGNTNAEKLLQGLQYSDPHIVISI